jgi:hypothetical protein
VGIFQTIKGFQLADSKLLNVLEVATALRASRRQL